MPFSRTYTSVCDVPKSIPKSFEKRPNNLLNIKKERCRPFHSTQGKKHEQAKDGYNYCSSFSASTGRVCFKLKKRNSTKETKSMRRTISHQVHNRRESNKRATRMSRVNKTL